MTGFLDRGRARVKINEGNNWVFWIGVGQGLRLELGLGLRLCLTLVFITGAIVAGANVNYSILLLCTLVNLLNGFLPNSTTLSWKKNKFDNVRYHKALELGGGVLLHVCICI